MIEKTPLIARRVRRIQGSFAAIEHRFLRAGFWAALNHHELLLYLFLVLLAVSVDEYAARAGLIDQD
jgi:hypothetical protein